MPPAGPSLTVSVFPLQFNTKCNTVYEASKVAVFNARLIKYSNRILFSILLVLNWYFISIALHILSVWVTCMIVFIDQI